MPFCTHCGSQVADRDAFCARCGARQEGAPAPSKSFLDKMDSRTASTLCYIPVVGWIACVVVLAARRFKNERVARFHAFQGLYLFVAYLVIDWGVMPFFLYGGPRMFHFGIQGILKAAVFVTWIFMLVKTSQNVDFRLPIFGDLADRSLAEQK
jgi:uncharacterized membrane protein